MEREMASHGDTVMQANVSSPPHTTTRSQGNVTNRQTEMSKFRTTASVTIRSRGPSLPVASLRSEF